MDPSYMDEDVTAFDIYNMISSQNDLSTDPSNQPGTSDSARPAIPYKVYHHNTSPSTDFTSSSGGNRVPSPEELDVDDVVDYFNGNSYLSPEEIEIERAYNQDRENIQHGLLETTLKAMANENLMIPPQAPMYPTPPLAEISPRAGNIASYHPHQTADSSYGQENYNSGMTSPSQPSRSKRPRPSSPGCSRMESYPMQPLLPPQTPHSIQSSNMGVDFRLSPPFIPYEQHSWVPVYDERQQQMNPVTMFIFAERGMAYDDNQSAYMNYRKTHLQLQVNIECVDCEQGFAPKFIWCNSFIPIKEFQVQIHGVRHHNQTSVIHMKQSDKDRKMYPAVFEGFEITETSTVQVLRRLHFGEATKNNNQVNGKPNPKQEFYDLVLRLVAVTMDGNQYIIQSHIAQKIICRAQNPGTFVGHGDDKSIKEEVDDEDELVSLQQTCWECGRNVISTNSQVVVGGQEPVEGAALTVRGDVVVGAIRTFCDERCKNVYKEKVDEELKEAYDQLKDLKIFEFSYKEEFAARMGLSPRKRDGFMAQQVREIIPEAVVEMGDFLSVDQAEIFIKSVSALKHLSSMAEQMQGNLNETMKQVKYILETVNNKRKTKSMISGINSEAMSRRSSVSTTYSIEAKRPRRRSPPSQQPYQDILCGSRFSQCTIISVVVMLVFVMAACLVSMTFLYFVDLTSRYGHNPIPTVFSPKKTPPENMVVPVNQLAHLQQNVSMLAPKCSGGHCHQYCCDRETIGNATAYMLRENVIVPMRDGEEQTHHFGPLPDMSILIPELNITLDKSFCVSQSCNRHRKQYKLFIPLSPSFPKAPLTVKFRLNSAKIVQLCGDVDGFRQKKCMKSINMEKRLVARQVDPSTFELPVGGYLQSGYKFHVSYSPDSCDILLEDSSRSMEEYNLIFYRKCF